MDCSHRRRPERKGRLVPVLRGSSLERKGRLVPVLRGSSLERKGRLVPVLRGSNWLQASGEMEPAALALLALHPNAPVHHSNQTAGDGQTETRASELPRVGAVHLSKGVG